MADVTHKQLLDAIQANTGMLQGIGDTVADIADNMATKGDLLELANRLDSVEIKLHAKIDRAVAKNDESEARLDDKIDGVELRLGRRIDAGFAKNVHNQST